jgi:hypothetical protein
MATGPGEVTPPVAAKKSNGCLKAFIIVACIVAFLGIGTVILFGFVLNKAANTISDKVNAQQKIENETGIKSSSFNTTNPPQKDISAKDMTCTTDASGNMTASGQLTNHSSKSSSYLVEISFRQNGSEIGTASDLVLGVDAGKTGSWSATSTVGASGGFTCKIYSIDRWDTGSIPPVSTPN